MILFGKIKIELVHRDYKLPLFYRSMIKAWYKRAVKNDPYANCSPKLGVIKVVKENFDLYLKDAKELVEEVLKI